jgi:hypothetical protein
MESLEEPSPIQRGSLQKVSIMLPSDKRAFAPLRWGRVHG